VKSREGGLARGGSRTDAEVPGPTPSPSDAGDRSAAERSPDLPRPELAWSDARLIRACLDGREEAWSALIGKYKNLIFSIPVRRGIPRDEAADVFQRVCLLLLAELPRLREAKALPMWLIRVTSRECSRWRRQERPFPGSEDSAGAEQAAVDEQPLADELLARHHQERALREAVLALPPRCRELVSMLFFETPARPYQEVARHLGLAEGSIGFIRGRCLGRLRRELEKKGFR
jgi:RNA polymerase sigma factor (sigma-70 family)